LDVDPKRRRGNSPMASELRRARSGVGGSGGFRPRPSRRQPASGMVGAGCRGRV